MPPIQYYVFDENNNQILANGMIRTRKTCINYYKNGYLHREDGPASIDNYLRSEDWYLNGIFYNIPEEMPLSLFVEYCKWTTNKKEKKKLKYESKLFTDNSGNQYYRNSKRQLNREDGPAMITARSSYWYRNGKSHREDGPAVIIFCTGNRVYEAWYYNGMKYDDVDKMPIKLQKAYHKWQEQKTGDETFTYIK